MLVPLKTLMKREVVILDDGLNLGRPQDIVIDPEKHQVAVIVVARGTAPEISIVCRADAVQSFGADVLAVPDLKSTQLAFHDGQMLNLVRGGIRFRGQSVLTHEGKKLGRITRVAVDDTGKVVEYQIRRGLLGWLGRRERVAPKEVEKVGTDMTVLKRRNAK